MPRAAGFQTGWYEGSMDWIPDAGSLIESARAIRERMGLGVYRAAGLGVATG